MGTCLPACRCAHEACRARTLFKREAEAARPSATDDAALTPANVTATSDPPATVQWGYRASSILLASAGDE
eukprot:15211741-Alexandrium_andersonii.AAC.1